MAEGDGDDEMTLADKLRGIREKVQRKEQATRADRRAKGRRIERGEPDSTAEKAAVAKRSASEAADEAKNLGEDAVDLISTELGVSESEAEGVISQGADAIRSAAEAGDGALDQLDFDEDGDTDLFDAVESGAGFEGGGRGDTGPPIGGVEDDIEPAGGIEEELGLDEPIEETDGGLF